MRIVFYLVAMAVVSLGMWVTKVRTKRLMKEKLGREVNDYDVTSIKSWMDMPRGSRPPGED